MRKRHYTLRSVNAQSSTTLTLTLVPDSQTDIVTYLPGQYVSLAYHAQHSLSPVRSFSIANAPNESGVLEFSVRLLGQFTRSLALLAPGTRFDVYGPSGNFVLKNQNTLPVFLAAGIGITPFMSMLRQAASSGFSQRIFLFYSNRSESDIPYGDELSRLSQTYTNFHYRLHLFDQLQGTSNFDNVRYGFLSKESIQEVLGSEVRAAQYYLCGPPAFMDNLSQQLREGLGISDQNINSESFSQGNKDPLFAKIPRSVYIGTSLAFLATTFGVVASDVHSTQTTATPTPSTAFSPSQSSSILSQSSPTASAVPPPSPTAKLSVSPTPSHVSSPSPTPTPTPTPTSTYYRNPRSGAS